MALLNNKDVNMAYRRAVAKGTKRCVIKDVRESAGKDKGDGKPVKDTMFVSLQLTEAAKTTDGDDIAPGGVFDVSFNTVADPAGDTKLETMNRISRERFRELLIAALGLPDNCKDVIEQFESRGGVSSLIGKEVVVDWSPTKQGMNNVDKFAAVPA